MSHRDDRRHLKGATKVARMGHFLRMDGETSLDEQGDVRPLPADPE